MPAGRRRHLFGTLDCKGVIMLKAVVATVIGILACAAMGRADDVPEEIKPKVETARRLRESELQRLRTELARLPRPGATRESNMEMIAFYKQRISELEKKGGLPDQILRGDSLAVGSVGRLGGQWWVRQIIGDDKMLVSDRDTGPLQMLHKVPTKGLVDGEAFRIEEQCRVPGLVEVYGTEQYRTITGAQKTVAALRWHDVDDSVRSYLEPLKQPAMKRSQPEAKPPPSTRTWKDATGQFSVKAAFRGIIGGNVQLEREDGNKLSIPMDQLSDECQEWIRERSR